MDTIDRVAFIWASSLERNNADYKLALRPAFAAIA